MSIVLSEQKDSIYIHWNTDVLYANSSEEGSGMD